MNMYPAMRASMGSWDYYMVKMRMEDLVKEVEFAHEIHEDKTLDEAIQRSLNESRVKKEIVKYLAYSEDRFFNSIVVAALGGNPNFISVSIDEDPRFELLPREEFNETFGVLAFDGKQRYYALDGQHRLMSIKTLIEQTEAGTPDIPKGFRDEEISIIMLVKQEKDEDFMRSYRRVFSNLNRYAKATDLDTNITMDEDDAIAIVTRRLLLDYDFFRWQGRSVDSKKIQTRGKNLRSGDPYFSSLQTLYSMNNIFLHTPRRGREHKKFEAKTNEFKRFRPEEDIIDQLYNELVVYWDALLSTLPVLKKSPLRMREHNYEDVITGEGNITDHLLFWPIGQEMLAQIVRILLNRRLPDTDNFTLEEAVESISPLTSVDWELHSAPWKYLLLVPDSKKKNIWKMRNEERNEAVKVGIKLLCAMTGIDELSESELSELKTDWLAMLTPRPKKDESDRLWASIF